MSSQKIVDVLIIGAGHNGLVTAAHILARAGMSVRVFWNAAKFSAAPASPKKFFSPATKFLPPHISVR